MNRTDKISRSLVLLTPRRSPNSALPLHTHKQCTARGRGPLGVLPSLSLDHQRLLDIPLGDDRQAFRQPSDASIAAIIIIIIIIIIVC